jgi:hypothetical protein
MGSPRASCWKSMLLLSLPKLPKYPAIFQGAASDGGAKFQTIATVKDPAGYAVLDLRSSKKSTLRFQMASIPPIFEAPHSSSDSRRCISLESISLTLLSHLSSISHSQNGAIQQSCSTALRRRVISRISIRTSDDKQVQHSLGDLRG